MAIIRNFNLALENVEKFDDHEDTDEAEDCERSPRKPEVGEEALKSMIEEGKQKEQETNAPAQFESKENRTPSPCLKIIEEEVKCDNLRTEESPLKTET